MAFIQDMLVYKGKGPAPSAKQSANYDYELATYKNQASSMAAHGLCCMT